MTPKEKRVLIIVSSLLIVIFLYHYGLLSRYNYLTAKVDIRRGNIQLISATVVGESYIFEENVAGRYNIKMDLVQPIFLFNNITYKGVDIYNQQMEKQIKINLGEEKYRKYKNDLDSTLNAHEFILSPLIIEIPKNQ